MAKAKNTDDQTAKKAPAKKTAASQKSANPEIEGKPVAKKGGSGKSLEAGQKTAAPATEKSPAKGAIPSKAAIAKPERAPQASKPAAASNESNSAATHSASTLEEVALPATEGKAGVLGGPKDRGIKPDDKLALPVGRHFTFERIRSLNPKSFYCAMRWEYHLQGKSPEESKRWWANKKLLVANPANGKQIVVRAVDFGPHENTGLTISLSPGALEALDLEIGGQVHIAFADQKAPLGVVNE